MNAWHTFKEKPLTDDDVGKWAFVLYRGGFVMPGKVLSHPRNLDEFFITDAYAFPLATHYCLIGYAPIPPKEDVCPTMEQ